MGEEQGPGAGRPVYQPVDFFGSVLLVWIAFFALFRAESVHTTFTLQRQEAADSRAKAQRVPGGRMIQLLVYDMVCFWLSWAFIMLVSLLTTRDPVGYLGKDVQFWQTVFWGEVLYSLFSLPFAPLSVGIVMTLVTHATPSGYDEQGDCVEFCFRDTGERRLGRRERLVKMYDHGIADMLGHIKIAMAEGALTRGGSDTNYQFGDITRGVLVKLRRALSEGDATPGSEAASVDGDCSVGHPAGPPRFIFGDEPLDPETAAQDSCHGVDNSDGSGTEGDIDWNWFSF